MFLVVGRRVREAMKVSMLPIVIVIVRPMRVCRSSNTWLDGYINEIFEGKYNAMNEQKHFSTGILWSLKEIKQFSFSHAIETFASLQQESEITRWEGKELRRFTFLPCILVQKLYSACMSSVSSPA